MTAGDNTSRGAVSTVLTAAHTAKTFQRQRKKRSIGNIVDEIALLTVIIPAKG
jgi:hypothetical protein